VHCDGIQTITHSCPHDNAYRRDAPQCYIPRMSEMPQIVVRVPADLKAELEREAKEDGRTLGSLVRLILDRRHTKERES